MIASLLDVATEQFTVPSLVLHSSPGGPRCPQRGPEVRLSAFAWLRRTREGQAAPPKRDGTVQFQTADGLIVIGRFGAAGAVIRRMLMDATGRGAPNEADQHGDDPHEHRFACFRLLQPLMIEVCLHARLTIDRTFPGFRHALSANTDVVAASLFGDQK